MIAEWVKSARNDAGLSGASLGAQLELVLGSARGHTRANISHWETGKHEPSLQQIMAIVQITGKGLPDELVAALRNGKVSAGELSGSVAPIAVPPPWMDGNAFRLLQLYYSLDERRRENAMRYIQLESDRAADAGAGSSTG